MRDFDAESVYNTLEKIRKLKEQIPPDPKETDDGLVRTINELTDSIPTLISREDLVKYHNYLLEVGKEVAKFPTDLKERILATFRKRCTYEAYAEVERALN